jgi:hypothetical protein
MAASVISRRSNNQNNYETNGSKRPEPDFQAFINLRYSIILLAFGD